MQKIGDSTSTANGAGEFTQGQPGSGIDATMITASWLNAVQREMGNAISGAGIALDPADDSQLLKAIKALLLAANTWEKLTGKPTTVSGFGITDAFTRTETSNAIQQAIAALVASSPAALDTLKELADALGNDPNFATTVMNALSGKAGIASIQSQTFTAFTTAGTSAALTLAPIPAITSYVKNQRFQVEFSAASGAGGSTLNVSGVGPQSLKQYDSAGEKVPAVFAKWQTSDVLFDGVDLVLLDPLPVKTVIKQGVRGAAIDRRAAATGTSAGIPVTASSLTLADSNGNCFTVDNLNLTLNTAVIASATLSGMVGGAIAASTWYGIYIWRNSTTGAVIATADPAYSTGAAVTPPAAGFDMWARHSAFLSDASASKFPMGFTFRGKIYQWLVAAGSNITGARLMASGAAGNPNNNVWVPVSVSPYVGPSATRIMGAASMSNGGSLVAAPNNAYASINGALTDTGSPVAMGGQATAFLVSQSFEFILESANIYWASTLAVGRLWCLGWEDSL